MKYRVAPRFQTDWTRLSPAERELFRKVVHEDFIPAVKHRLADPSAAWPAHFRIRAIANAPGIWEMTWSFARPDGRATFELIRIGSEPAIRWRRIGGHAIFGEP